MPDELVDAFAVKGDPTEVADQLQARYAGLVDRLGLNLQAPAPDEQLAAVIEKLRAFNRPQER